MKLPITNDSGKKPSGQREWLSVPDFSSDDNCPICNSKIDNGDFVCMNFASFPHGKDGKVDAISLSISAHFDSKNKYGNTNMIECDKTEQLDFYVCSIDCMRKFFNQACDDLEKKTFPQDYRDRQINKII